MTKAGITLPDRLPAAFHAQDLARNLEYWQDAANTQDERLTKFMRDAVSLPEISPLMNAVFGCSPYLTRQLLHFPHVLMHFHEDGPDSFVNTLMLQMEVQHASHFLRS